MIRSGSCEHQLRERLRMPLVDAIASDLGGRESRKRVHRVVSTVRLPLTSVNRVVRSHVSLWTGPLRSPICRRFF